MKQEKVRPCINHATCRGFAEPGRALCSCCIAAQEELEDLRNKQIIQKAGTKNEAKR
jgi:hypothetical protein